MSSEDLRCTSSQSAPDETFQMIARPFQPLPLTVREALRDRLAVGHHGQEVSLSLTQLSKRFHRCEKEFMNPNFVFERRFAAHRRWQ